MYVQLKKKIEIQETDGAQNGSNLKWEQKVIIRVLEVDLLNTKYPFITYGDPPATAGKFANKW